MVLNRILEGKKSEKCLDEKNAKITKKKSHAYKGYAIIYNITILYNFNHELQLRDTESAIKSKLIDLLSELRGFKFATTLKIESDDEINIAFSI